MFPSSGFNPVLNQYSWLREKTTAKPKLSNSRKRLGYFLVIFTTSFLYFTLRIS